MIFQNQPALQGFFFFFFCSRKTLGAIAFKEKISEWSLVKIPITLQITITTWPPFMARNVNGEGLVLVSFQISWLAILLY